MVCELLFKLSMKYQHRLRYHVERR